MLLKLLLSINCQTTAAYRVVHSLPFHHLWVRHIVNYIIPPHMWVRHIVRNVDPPHLGFSFLVGPPPSFLYNRSFQSYQNPDNYKSWRSLFYHLWVRHTVNYIISSHMWVRHTATNLGKTHLGFSFLVGPSPSFLCNRSFQSYQNPDDFKS